jgi:hypothetical protein
MCHVTHAGQLREPLQKMFYRLLVVERVVATRDLRSPELPDEDLERASFFHSIKSLGISSKKREPGLYLGLPKVNRYSAREIYSRFSARVKPTYAKRRSSSISFGSSKCSGMRKDSIFHTGEKYCWEIPDL